MKAIGRGGGEGWDKEEGEREKGGKHTPGFLQHPQFELSRKLFPSVYEVI
jgi:hypothetical protein